MDFENDEDEILYEIDVICNLDSNSKLNIFQYPLIPFNKKSLENINSLPKTVGKTQEDNYIIEDINDEKNKILSNIEYDYNYNSTNNKNKTKKEHKTNNNTKNPNLQLKGKKIYPNTNYFIGCLINKKLILIQ